MTSNDGPHRLDDETINIGRANLSRLRRQLRIPAEHAQPVKPDPVVDVEISTDRIAAEMAAGAHRDALIARVEQLEAEVTQLRSALAAVLEAASSGLQAPTKMNESPHRQ